MIVNVIGTNYAGKTTLIENSLAACPSCFLDIRRYREFIDHDFYKTSPRAVGPPGAQWALARSHPAAAFSSLKLVASGRPVLARRFWRYFFIHASLVAAAPRVAPGRDLVIVDEGLPKKFIEAVPFVKRAESDAARREWHEVMAHHGKDLVSSLKGLADRFIFVDAAPGDITARAQKRTPDFFANVGEEAMIVRHEIQAEAFRSFLALAREAGLPSVTINTSEPDAQARFNAALLQKE